MQTVEMAAIRPDLAESALGDSARNPLPARTALLLVAAGGAAGAVLRFTVSGLLPSTATLTFTQIPTATLMVNILGCLALGVLAGHLETRGEHPAWVHPLLAVGLCGGFTTVSTVSLQTAAMLGADFPLIGLEYLLITLGSTIGATVLGLVLGRILGARLRLRAARR